MDDTGVSQTNDAHKPNLAPFIRSHTTNDPLVSDCDLYRCGHRNSCRVPAFRKLLESCPRPRTEMPTRLHAAYNDGYRRYDH